MLKERINALVKEVEAHIEAFHHDEYDYDFYMDIICQALACKSIAYVSVLRGAFLNYAKMEAELKCS